MVKIMDLTGQRYGKLTVIGFAERKNRRTFWKCLCDCGNEIVMWAATLRKKTKTGVRGCGCQRGVRHGKRWTSEYKSWSNMLSRCGNIKHPDYPYYGGRGISVAKQWIDFSVFISDVGEMPKPGLTLGRINNSGNYEPGNVRWETRKQQANNKRNNRLIAARGECHTVAEWSRITGLNEAVIRNRANRGWAADDCIGPKATRWSRRKSG